MHNDLQPPAPLFSVITVTYNAAKVVEVTLRSVLSQTYPHVEYIIVDGASTDGTPAILEKYRSRLQRIISEPDRGLYDAMNKGIAAATGDYVCFLNAGDCFHHASTLQEVAESFRGKELPDVIYGETAIVNARREFLRMRRLSTPEVLHWKSFKQGMLVCHQAFFAKRALASTEPYDLKYRYSADFDWCIRIMKRAHTLHNTHLTLADYLEEGMTTQNHKASLMERFRIMAKHYGWVSTVTHHVWFVVRAFLRR